MAGTALQTADAGYLTRRLVDVAQNSIVVTDDCGTDEGVLISRASSDDLKKNIFDRIYGRYLLKDIEVDGEVLAKAGDLVNHQLLNKLKQYDNLDNIWIRSITKCELSRGICRKCYGIDFSTHQPVNLGVAVGVIGAQSLGEPTTQLAVSSVKQGVAAGAKSDITSGLQE
jgi:DNA-directed RNA polymerase subunit beta'